MSICNFQSNTFSYFYTIIILVHIVLACSSPPVKALAEKRYVAEHLLFVYSEPSTETSLKNRTPSPEK